MKFYKFVSLFAIATLTLTACESGSSSDPSDKDYGNIFLNAYPSDEVSNEFEAELYTNFVWLDIAYIYGHTRNEMGASYKQYLGKGNADVNKVKGYCTANYYDVCYMYNQLSDKYTRYYDPNIAEKVYKSFTESDEIVGIGAEVETVSGETSNKLVITRIYPNSPSEKAGLQEGDIIQSIDGLPITTPENFEQMCSGDKGSTIKITVLRGEESISANVVIEEYNSPTVEIHYEDSIPVIEILEFSRTTINPNGTYGEYLDALEKTAGAKATIIDLRRNPGGDVENCNNVSSEFLFAGDTILRDVSTDIDSVWEDNRWKAKQKLDTITYLVEKDGIGRDRYYVLLSSDTSASCAEVVLSAVTVNRKFPVVGKTSYGKAIGQGFFTEEEYGIRGMALITALEGIDKNGETYQDLGIAPDFEITDPDEQMKKAVELAKEASFVRTAGYGTKKLGHFTKEREKDESSYKKIPTFRELKARYKVMKH